MATKKQKDEEYDLDTTYYTHQRGVFSSGLAAQIKGDGFLVWSAIKSFADFETGESWPSIRTIMRDTGLSSETVQKAIDRLEELHLLRIKRGTPPKPNTYVPRERMDVRIGNRVLCTIVIDYVPLSMRERLAKIKASAKSGDFSSDDVWADVDLIPGQGMIYDQTTGLFKTRMMADEVTAQPNMTVSTMRERLKHIADDMRKNLPK